MVGFPKLWSCVKRACVQDPEVACAETCAGCCEGATCRPGDTDASCGGAGVACGACAANWTCEGRQCVLDPASLWDIVAVDATVLAEAPAGGWDAAGGKPDLFVEVGTDYDGSKFLLTGRTTTKSDTLSATWQTTVIEAVQAQILLDQGLGVTLYDEDLISNDTIGSCGLLVEPAAFDGLPMDTCGSFGTFEFRYRLVPRVF